MSFFPGLNLLSSAAGNTGFGNVFGKGGEVSAKFGSGLKVSNLTTGVSIKKKIKESEDKYKNCEGQKTYRELMDPTQGGLEDYYEPAGVLNMASVQKYDGSKYDPAQCGGLLTMNNRTYTPNEGDNLFRIIDAKAVMEMIEPDLEVESEADTLLNIAMAGGDKMAALLMGKRGWESLPSSARPSSIKALPPNSKEFGDGIRQLKMQLIRFRPIIDDIGKLKNFVMQKRGLIKPTPMAVSALGAGGQSGSAAGGLAGAVQGALSAVGLGGAGASGSGSGVGSGVSGGGGGTGIDGQ